MRKLMCKSIFFPVATLDDRSLSHSRYSRAVYPHMRQREWSHVFSLCSVRQLGGWKISHTGKMNLQIFIGITLEEGQETIFFSRQRTNIRDGKRHLGIQKTVMEDMTCSLRFCISFESWFKVFIMLMHVEKQWIHKHSRRNNKFINIVWKSYVLGCVHECVLHIPLYASQNGNGGKSCTKCAGQFEDSSPGTGDGVCTNTRGVLGLCTCAWSPG